MPCQPKPSEQLHAGMMVRVPTIRRGEDRARVADDHDRRAPNPSARISSTRRALSVRRSLDSPIPKNLGGHSPCSPVAILANPGRSKARNPVGRRGCGNRGLQQPPWPGHLTQHQFDTRRLTQLDPSDLDHVDQPEAAPHNLGRPAVAGQQASGTKGTARAAISARTVGTRKTSRQRRASGQTWGGLAEHPGMHDRDVVRRQEATSVPNDRAQSPCRQAPRSGTVESDRTTLGGVR